MMRTFTSFCLIVIEIIVIQQIVYISAIILPEDATLNTTGLATKYGHPAMQYNVVTEDGYILNIFRLPGKGRNARIPILLTHGIEDSSDVWLLRGKDSLGITLANDGCDVWLSNNRGNRYSRRHEYLDPDTGPKFWQFSFHEMGYYDLPAIIDTVLKETGAENLTAIAHSQGTTAFFVLGSERKEYNSKINVFVALAPVAYLHNAPAPLSTIIQLSPTISLLFKLFRVYELLGDYTEFGKFVHTYCSVPVTGYLECGYGALFPLTGFDLIELEGTFFPIVATRKFAGSSSLSIMHFLQVGLKKIFAQYDYGSEINQKVYKSPEPPAYQLNQVTMPVALMVGKNDHVSDVPDTAILRQQLPNVVYYLEHPRPLMNHLDFVVGKNMRFYLFNYIYRVLRQHNHFN